MEEGSKITGHKTSSVNGAVYVLNQGSSFTMNGGEISDNESTSTTTGSSVGGVWIGLNSEFIMNGGKISGNTRSTTDYGVGGIYGDTGSKITMNGGEISENTGTVGGTGGVRHVGGTGSSFTMNGGKISGNTGGSAGGLYIGSGTVFTMNGGEISGNNGINYGGVHIVGSSVSPNICRMTGGKISGNTGAYDGGLIIVNSSFLFSGGSITGNTGPRSGDFNFAGSTLILAETASAPNITLQGGTAATQVGITSGWTGEVATLNLYYNDVSYATVVSNWVGKKVITNSNEYGAYALTSADIDKFKLVNFVNSNYIPRKISDEGRTIVRTGANIGNLQ
jgi:hypothetical protein